MDTSRYFDMSSLGQDVLIKITKHLDLSSLSVFLRVCKYTHAISTHRDVVLHMASQSGHVDNWIRRMRSTRIKGSDIIYDNTLARGTHTDAKEWESKFRHIMLCSVNYGYIWEQTAPGVDSLVLLAAQEFSLETYHEKGDFGKNRYRLYIAVDHPRYDSVVAFLKSRFMREFQIQERYPSIKASRVRFLENYICNHGGSHSAQATVSKLHPKYPEDWWFRVSIFHRDGIVIRETINRALIPPPRHLVTKHNKTIPKTIQMQIRESTIETVWTLNTPGLRETLSDLLNVSL